MLGLREDVLTRCSQFLLDTFNEQIIASNSNLPNVIPGCPSKIIAEIQCLEGYGDSQGTKASSPLKNNPLACKLMHKHYATFYGVARNITECLGKSETYGSEKTMLKRVECLLEKHRKPHTTYLELEDTPTISNAVVDLYSKLKLDSKLTGEWLIYAIYNEKNHYLCLGNHDNDNLWLSNLEKCRIDFPFLWRN